MSEYSVTVICHTHTQRSFCHFHSADSDKNTNITATCNN